MKGLNYKSILTYSYSKSNEEMKRILQQDGFNNYQLNDDQKIVEYKIDHSMQIQLTQLLYLYEIKLIKLSIAQSIQLCLDILVKYKKLKEQNVQHNYLSSDRIIINIKDKQSQITVLPANLNYTIHFVGYDCPFYERDNYINSQKNDDQSIKEIIINIIQNSKRYNLTQTERKESKQIYSDKKKQDEKEKEFKEKYSDLVLIYKALLDEGIFKSFDKFIEASKLIFEKYKNQNNIKQKLDGVDKIFQNLNFKRTQRKDNVIKNFKKIQKTHYKEGQSYEYQQILQLTFPLIVNELRKAIIYDYQNPPENNVYINLKQQLNIDNQMIKEMIKENEEEIMKDYKFELDLEMIKNDISTQLTDKFKIFNYFLNDVKFSKQSDKQNLVQNQNYILISINNLKKEITKEVTIQSFQNYLKLRILQLNEDLL